MAILIANDGDKIVNTIAERDAIINKFDGMEVTVKDAIADVMVGAGRAGYQWDTGAQAWKLVWKHNKDDLVFVTENLPISNGLVTLTNSPQSALVWDSFVTDAAGNMLVKLSNPQVTGKSVSIGSADYNGETLWVSYAYGKIQAAVQATAIAKVTSTDNALVRFNGTTGEVQDSLVVVDDTGNVGIGTNTPTEKLDVVGNVKVSGGVSINGTVAVTGVLSTVIIGKTTDDGVNKLQVNGSVSVQGDNPIVKVLATNLSGATTSLELWGSASGTNYKSAVIQGINYGHLNLQTPSGVGNNSFITLATDAAERMRIDSSGNVGIGTTAPTEKLDVTGNAIVRGTLSVGSLFKPQQAAAAPTYVKGAIYFDTTLNKLRVGGATAWETLTSV